jgi:hypothetical protein
MISIRRLFTVLAFLTLLPVAIRPALSEEVREVLVVNLPEVQQVRGSVSVDGPVPQTELVRLSEAIVAPVDPEETTALVSGGTVVAEGFVSVVLSLAGQVKAQFFQPGQVGAILIPDEQLTREAFDEAGQLLFPLRVEATAGAEGGAYFASEQPEFQLGFPRYRVYFYNTTDRPASVSLFAYLSN